MKLNDEQRLILLNQYRILAIIDSDSKEHYEQAAEIVQNGYEIFYSDLGWIDSPMAKEDCILVLNILDFYRAVEDYKRVHSDPEITSHPFGYFRGFDGNNESEYLGFARFLLRQDKFAEQKDYLKLNDGMNSHSPFSDKYRRMVDKFEKYRSKWRLDKSELLSVLDA